MGAWSREEFCFTLKNLELTERQQGIYTKSETTDYKVALNIQEKKMEQHIKSILYIHIPQSNESSWDSWGIRKCKGKKGLSFCPEFKNIKRAQQQVLFNEGEMSCVVGGRGYLCSWGGDGMLPELARWEMHHPRRSNHSFKCSICKNPLISTVKLTCSGAATVAFCVTLGNLKHPPVFTRGMLQQRCRILEQAIRKCLITKNMHCWRLKVKMS